MNLNIKDIIAFARGYLSNGSERTVKAKKNVLLMLLYKGGSIAISFLLVPLTINYVDSTNYGIWLTLSSMVAWMSFFDIGLNNGLKNKLTEALAYNNYELGRKYVSTTYAILTLIFVPLMLILLVATPFINWSSLLHLASQYEKDLVIAVAILVVYFCMNFILSTINVVMTADQEPAAASLRSFIQQAVSLVFIYVLTITTQGSLTKLCLGLCVSPLIVIAVFNITLFRGRYAALAPRLRNIDFSVAPDLMKLGVQFFIIQVAGVVQWQMTNFLIIRYFGATSVTEYNIAYKYFSVLTMIWGIFTTPIWAAVTDASAKNDFGWIKRTIQKFMKLLIVFTLGGLVMLVISPFAYHIWIGNKVSIDFLLSAAVLIYCLATMISGIFVAVVNGSGKLKVQMYACVVSPIIYLGIFFLCASYLNIGVYSIIIASIIANYNGLILAPIQCRKMLNVNKSSL